MCSLLCFWGLRCSSMHLPAQAIIEFHDFQSSSELEPGQIKYSAVPHFVPYYLMRTPHCTPQGSFSAQFHVFIISINYSGLDVRPQTIIPKVLTLDSNDCTTFGCSSLTPTSVPASLFYPENDKLGFKPCLPDVIFGRIPKALPILAPLLRAV